MKAEKSKSLAAAVMIITLSACLGAAIARTQVFGEEERSGKPNIQVAENTGADIFQKSCSDCHYDNSTDTKMGPGLKDLFKRGELPVSGKAVNEANVLKQLNNPYKNMPSFKDMSPAMKQSIIDYLKTL